MTTDQTQETGRMTSATPPRPHLGTRNDLADTSNHLGDTNRFHPADIGSDPVAATEDTTGPDTSGPDTTLDGADPTSDAEASAATAEPTGETTAAGPTDSPTAGGQATVVRRKRGRRLSGWSAGSSGRSHRVLLVVVAALLGSGIALTGNLLVGPEYTSESGVLWDPSSAQLVDQTVSVDPNLLDRQVTDQQDVINSDAIISAASTVLGIDAKDLRDAISTSVTQGSSLITISAKADDPAEATRIASAVTDAYVANLKTTGAASLNSRADALQSTIDRQNSQLATLTDQLTAQTNQLAGVAQTSSTFAVLQSQVTQLSAQVADLTTRIAVVVDQQEGLRADSQIYPGAAYVLQQADEPLGPSTFSVPVTIALGAALGALLAGCIIGIQVLRRPSRTGTRAGDAPPARG